MANTEHAVIIESLDHEGRGIAHADGKVIFIEGALTGERVTYSSYRKKNNYEQAKVEQILKQSFMRVQPKCPNFGVCGGCSMQHLDPRAQVAVKQRVLEDNLQRIGKVKPEVMLPPIYGQPWGYRQRARLSVRHVLKKSKTLVGFREKNGKYVADMQHCEILTPKIASLLPLLGELNEKFTVRDILPQIEVAVGEHVDVLVLRILEALTPSDVVHDQAICRQASSAVLDADQRAGNGHSVLPAGRTATELQPAGIRHHHAVRADRIHPGEQRHESPDGQPRHAFARPATRRTHRRFLLRSGQLHPADRAQRRAGAGHRRQ